MNDITQALRYARTFYQRCFLALASSLYSVFTLCGPALETYTYCGPLPRNLVLPQHFKYVAAAAFALDAVMLWWRIFDNRARVAWATITNIITAGLWLTITVSNVAVYHQVWSANVGEIMLTLTALFVLSRTDYTAIDKGTA